MNQITNALNLSASEKLGLLVMMALVTALFLAVAYYQRKVERKW